MRRAALATLTWKEARSATATTSPSIAFNFKTILMLSDIDLHEPQSGHGRASRNTHHCQSNKLLSHKYMLPTGPAANLNTTANAKGRSMASFILRLYNDVRKGCVGNSTVFASVNPFDWAYVRLISCWPSRLQLPAYCSLLQLQQVTTRPPKVAWCRFTVGVTVRYHHLVGKD